MKNSKKVAVIGAGISGLTCAYELKRAGFDVTVYEKNAYVGGRMSTRVKDGFAFDLGADHLSNVYDHMIAYCNDFDIPWKKMAFEEYRVLKNGKLTLFKDLTGWLSRTRLAMLFMKIPKGIQFFNLTPNISHDSEQAYTFFKKKSGKENADYIADPMSSTYQFHRADEISLGVVYGMMKMIQSRKEDWILHRTPGGMQTLPNMFASKLDVRLETPVKSVKREGDQLVVRTSTDERFDAVVMATPTPATNKILEEKSPKLQNLLEQTKYAATISVAFRVKKEKLPATSIVWVPFVESQKISGYVNELYKEEDTTVGDESLVCTWLHEEFAQMLMNKSDEEVFDTVREALLEVCPWFESAADLAAHDLERWELAMPKFAQGHLTRVADFLESEQGQDGVFLCGDYLNAPWTEGALRCGQRVAKHMQATI